LSVGKIKNANVEQAVGTTLAFTMPLSLSLLARADEVVNNDLIDHSSQDDLSTPFARALSRITVQFTVDDPVLCRRFA
jgi:hypothetical protein